MVGCGWDPLPGSRQQAIDLDVACFLLTAKNNLYDSRAFVYFRNLEARNSVVIHTGDNLTGDGDGDDERLIIDLESMPVEVVQIPIVCCIYDAAKRGTDIWRAFPGFSENC
jgi:tellurium resistance protein TerD